MKKYAYAVFDGYEAPDQYRAPISCHHTLAAARAAAARLNRRATPARYFAIAWDAPRLHFLVPGPLHLFRSQGQSD